MNSLHQGIRVSDLTVRYGSLTALRDVSLSVPARQIFALVGPSGCGKSTFLHCLNRMTDTIGNCRVDGEILLGDTVSVLSKQADLLELRRRVGTVFQNPAPFPQSIRRNFEIPMREHGISRSGIEGRMEQSLRDVGLWREISDRLHQSAVNLSGGQQQRLCIARALCLNPEVILFDEPCGALDPLASRVVEEHIVGLRDRVTVLIVTHNLAQARRIADHAAVFWLKQNCGTIVESGPSGILTSPTDPDARRYLGGETG